jgi:rare lipoprotein A
MAIHNHRAADTVFRRSNCFTPSNHSSPASGKSEIGVKIRRSVMLAVKITALLAIAPARADSGYTGALADANIFAMPTPSRAPIGQWLTTVIADRPAVGTWTTTVASSASRSGHPAPLPGPRLTGTGHALSGVASYYWQDQMTATGERFNKRDMTAAHKTLPFGTRVRVTRLDTGANVVVRINDRGPFKPGRIIDLSERAAENLGMTNVGTTPVRLEVLGQ